MHREAQVVLSVAKFVVRWRMSKDEGKGKRGSKVSNGEVEPGKETITVAQNKTTIWYESIW